QDLLSDGAGEERDRSFAARLAAMRGVDPAVRAMARGFVEGFFAAESRRASVRAIALQQKAGAAVGAEQAYRLLDGYDQIVCELVTGLDLRLGTSVTRVRWRRGRVELEARTAAGAAVLGLSAPRAIFTVPLAVPLAFSPRLGERERAVAALATGSVVKLVIWFRERFWHDGSLAFVHALGAAVPTWWTPLPLDAPVLVGWAGGPAGAALTGRPPARILAAGLRVLARMFRQRRQRLAALVQGFRVFDWQA